MAGDPILHNVEQPLHQFIHRPGPAPGYLALAAHALAILLDPRRLGQRHSPPVSERHLLEQLLHRGTVLHFDPLSDLIHLDLIADILAEHAEAQDLDPDLYFWEGWQLHAIAARIADRLERRGHVLLWEPASSIEDPKLYTRGKRLYEKVSRLWPRVLPG